MDQEQKPPSFLDDPDFDAQFSALDQGLRRPAAPAAEEVTKDATPPAPAPPPTPPPAPRAAFPAPVQPPAGSPRSIFPESAFARNPPASRFARAAAAEADRAAQGAIAPEPTAAVPRPLLELFPPPPVPEQQAAPWHTPVASAPPQVRIGSSRAAARPAEAPPPVSLTYESFYGLTEKPFTLSTDPRFIYHSTAHDRTMQELVDAVGRRELVMVLTGELGAGKTTLCRSLADQLRPAVLTSFVAEPVPSFEALMKAAQGSALIIVDDAQNLPAAVLEPLAGVAGVGDRSVQVLLVGTPALQSTLAQPANQALQRLVTVRCQLDPLTEYETGSYVAHRLAIAGVNARVRFDEDAVTTLHAVTRGVPRFVNLVCDRALALGFAASASVIDEAMIVAAASDLDLMPAESSTRRALRRAVAVLVVVASLLAGAGAAAWVFRADLARVLQALRP